MNQETLVEVRSVMTYDIYKKYFLFSIFRKRSYKPYLVFYSVIFFVGIFTSLFSIISFGFESVNVVVLLTLLVLGLLMLYVVVYAPKKYYKTAKKVIESLTIYRFTLEFLEVESKGDAASGNSSIRYDAFHKIYEMNELFYLFISDRQAYVVPKIDIPTDILEQLREIFKSKLGNKYHNYCNK